MLSDLHDELGNAYEILVVDDGSTTTRRSSPSAAHAASSGTARTAARGGDPDGEARRGEYVVIMDADATYPVSAIESLVELLTDHDLVRGNRESSGENMPLVNRIGNWFFSKLFAIAHGRRAATTWSGLYGSAARLRLGLEARLRHRDRDRDQGSGAGTSGDRVPDLLHAAGRRRSSIRGATGCGFSAG